MAGRHKRGPGQNVLLRRIVVAVVVILLIGGGAILANRHTGGSPGESTASGQVSPSAATVPASGPEATASGSGGAGSTGTATSGDGTPADATTGAPTIADTTTGAPTTGAPTTSGTSTSGTTTSVLAASSSSAPSQTFPQDQVAATAGTGPCVQLSVLTSLENADMVTALGAAYSKGPRNVDGQCVTVAVTRVESGVAVTDAAKGFPVNQPAVWIPDSSSWLGVARADGASEWVPASAPSIATSPTVLAMPEQMAAAIGWEAKAPTWAQVIKAAEDPKIWVNLGHPEWGTFKFGKTSPLVATSGLDGLLASYGAAAGHVAGLTPADVASSSVRAKVTAGELATSHYMATPEHFLWHVRQAQDAGSVSTFLSAVIVDEDSVWDYNRGITSKDGMTEMQSSPPTEKLVPIYPTDGVYEADNPAAAISGAWLSPPQQAAAQDFIRYLSTAQAQQLVQANGYRNINGVASAATAAVGRYGSGFLVLPRPAVNLVIAAQQSFPQVRKKARVLFLLDVSGSMSDQISPGLTKLQAAKQAVASALSYFTADDDIGLAAFSNYARGPVIPGLITPVESYGLDKAAFLAGLNSLSPVSETPLYAAVDQFASHMASGYQSDKINAVVVLSDGQNDSTQRETLTQLTTKLAAIDKSTPTLVFTLAYGKDADTTTLQLIAKTSGAHYYDATDPTTITAVLGDLVTSF